MEARGALGSLLGAPQVAPRFVTARSDGCGVTHHVFLSGYFYLVPGRCAMVGFMPQCQSGGVVGQPSAGWFRGFRATKPLARVSPRAAARRGARRHGEVSDGECEVGAVGLGAGWVPLCAGTGQASLPAAFGLGSSLIHCQPGFAGPGRVPAGFSAAGEGRGGQAKRAGPVAATAPLTSSALCGVPGEGAEPPPPRRRKK